MVHLGCEDFGMYKLPITSPSAATAGGTAGVVDSIDDELRIMRRMSVTSIGQCDGDH